MDLRVVTQRRTDKPVLAHLSGQIIDYTSNPFITFCLQEEQPGTEPSILILSSDSNATVALKIPLSNMISGSNELVTRARELGWKYPEQEFAEKRIKRHILESLVADLVKDLDEDLFSDEEDDAERDH